MNSDIQLPVYQVDSKLVAELCTGSLKHILFIREQLPIPFETIVKNNELSTYRPSIRKIETFLNHFSAIEDDLNSICSLIEIAEIQLIFGPSLTSPKEIYCLHLPRQQQNHESKTEDISMNKKYRECLRRTIRSYIQHWGEIDCRPLTPTNTFIAMRPHDSTTPTQFADAFSATSCFGHRQHAKVGGLVPKLKMRSQPPHHHWFLCKEQEQITEEEQTGKEEAVVRLRNDQYKHMNEHDDVHEYEEHEHHDEYANNQIVAGDEEEEQVMEITDTADTGYCTWLVLNKGIKGLKNIRLNT